MDGDTGVRAVWTGQACGAHGEPSATFPGKDSWGGGVGEKAPGVGGDEEVKEEEESWYGEEARGDEDDDGV